MTWASDWRVLPFRCAPVEASLVRKGWPDTAVWVEAAGGPQTPHLAVGGLRYNFDFASCLEGIDDDIPGVCHSGAC